MVPVDVTKMPAWSLPPKQSPHVDPTPSGGPHPSSTPTRHSHIKIDLTGGPLWRHTVWSLNSDVLAKFSSNDALRSRFELATDKLRCAIMLVDGPGDMTKHMNGPAALLCRCLGKILVHMEYLLDASSPATPVQWKPVTRGSGDRTSSFRVFLSEACKLKHQGMTRELTLLSELRPYPVTARHKFEVIADSASFLSRIENCHTLCGTRLYRWFVVKSEMEAAVAATASVLAVAPSSVKLVMRLSDFVTKLGSAHAPTETTVA